MAKKRVVTRSTKGSKITRTRARTSKPTRHRRPSRVKPIGRAKSRKEPAFNWFSVVTHGIRVKREDGRLLLVGLSQGQDDNWITSALETEAEFLNADTALDGVRSVYDHHAHEVLGAFPFAEATRVAENYATEWLTKAEVKPPCPCDDIEQPPELVDTTEAEVKPPCPCDDIEQPPELVDTTGLDPRGIPFASGSIPDCRPD